MAARARVGVLISGRGSNLGALIRASQAPDFAAEIALVIANVPGAGGLDLARDAGIATQVLDHKPHGKDRAAHEAQLHAALIASDIEIVCLAGYMRRLTGFLVRHWQGRMLNIHPALLPSFPGLDTHARALAAGVKWHGCTVHLVTEGVDEGPIIAQAAVPVLPDDSEDSLAARVLAAEHRLYPAALSGFVRRAWPAAEQTTAFFNPPIA